MEIYIVFEYAEHTSKIVGCYKNEEDANRKHDESPTWRYIEKQKLLWNRKFIKKGCVCMETIREQYDETLREVERLIDNLKALHTDIINANESDNLTMENSEELDWMCLTVDSAMQSVEEVAQAMARWSSFSFMKGRLIIWSIMEYKLIWMKWQD